MQVYANLKLQMWRTGLRQNRLAQMLDMDETNLSRIVNGFRKPGPELKERIAAVLQSDQEWLFEIPTSQQAERVLRDEKSGS